MNNSHLLTLTLCGAMTVTSAAADSSSVRFVGFSNQMLMGDAGIVAFHRACQAAFGLEARMCTTVEYFSSPNAAGATPTLAWIHPVVANDGGDFLTENGVRKCIAWSELLFPNTLTLTEGTVINEKGQVGEVRCDVARPITCCK